MTSLLETRLQAQINESQDSFEKAVKKAELACYWARIGNFDQADQIKVQLRADFGAGENTRVSILLILLEGLLHFFKDLSPLAKDRILRAKFLSKVFSNFRLLALSSAWLAHIDFNLCCYESMAESIGACIDNLAHDDGSAECRVALVLGDAFLCCQKKAISQAWYERARRAYASLGDQASIGAITYNRAAINAHNARLSSIVGNANIDDLRTIDKEISSAFNWQSLVNLSSLEHLLHLARLSVFMTERKYNLASVVAEKLFEEKSIPAYTSQYQIACVDRIICRLELEGVNCATEMLKLVDFDRLLELQADDRAIVFYGLTHIYKKIGNNFLYEQCKAIAEKSFQEHANNMDQLYKLIEPFGAAVAVKNRE